MRLGPAGNTARIAAAIVSVDFIHSEMVSLTDSV